MGWETNVDVTLYFTRQTYNSVYEVDVELDKINDSLRDAEKKLIVCMSSDPKNLIQKDPQGEEFTIYDSVLMTFSELINNYRDDLYDKWKLEMLKENWAKRSGDFVHSDYTFKCIVDDGILFTKDEIYYVNKLDDKNYIILTDNYEAVEISEEKLKKYFTQVEEEKED